jgi:N-acetylglucosaminyldiphosphoundecaprenol N-acetyl-beta-D-mannosaminyltransferase
MSFSTVTVLNTPCSLTTKEELLHHLERTARTRVVSVDFTNTQIVTMRRCQPDFKKTTDSVDYFIPDSGVLASAINYLSGTNFEKIYGPDFLAHAILNSAKETRHYFLGASQVCLDLLCKKINQLNPDFKIVGSHNGYFKMEDSPMVVQNINTAKPDLIWVGLGTPRQQEWINIQKNNFMSGAFLAVGFAFDVNAGTKKDAPPLFHKMNLVWLFRLFSEPKRLFLRYFKYNSLFIWYYLRQITARQSVSA